MPKKCQLLTFYNLGQKMMKNLDPTPHPSKNLKDETMAFCLSYGFILDFEEMEVCCSISFFPRLQPHLHVETV